MNYVDTHCHLDYTLCHEEQIRRVPSMQRRWADLSSNERRQWKLLRWNEFNWYEAVEGAGAAKWILLKKSWDELSASERGTVKKLGWKRSTWDSWETLEWQSFGRDRLTSDHKRLFRYFGFDGDTYEAWQRILRKEWQEPGLWPDNNVWKELSESEKKAAQKLGFSKETWERSIMADMDMSDMPDCDGIINSVCDPQSLLWDMPFLKNPRVHLTLGCHPKTAGIYATSDRCEFTANLTYEEFEEKLLETYYRLKDRVIAWGECGLDFANNDGPKIREKECLLFKRHMEFAKKFNFPLVVHSREAEELTISLMKENLPFDWKIHMHGLFCSKNMLDQLLSHFSNLFVGITSTCRSGWDEAEKFCLSVPLSRIVCETDSPWLPSIIDRGGKNLYSLFSHSKDIPKNIKQIAKLHEKDTLETFRIIRENTRYLYGI